MPKKEQRKKSNRGPREDFAKEDSEREDRIIMKIVVDAYGEQERAMGWYCYLESNLTFPFDAVCIDERQVSGLSPGNEVEVIGMAESDECGAEMFVLVETDEEGEVAVPLEQLRVAKGDAKTRRAVDDWRYWRARGYQF